MQELSIYPTDSYRVPSTVRGLGAQSPYAQGAYLLMGGRRRYMSESIRGHMCCEEKQSKVNGDRGRPL